MATSTTGGPPHWLNEKLTKEFLKNKVRLDDQDAEQVYQKLNENQIRNVRTLLGFSEESLVNQIGLAPGSAKELRNYVESCKVDETFLKEILCLENSEVQKVNPWLVAKGVSNVGRLLRLQSRDALQELGEGPAAELWRFIEKQKGGGKSGTIFALIENEYVQTDFKIDTEWKVPTLDLDCKCIRPCCRHNLF